MRHLCRLLVPTLPCIVVAPALAAGPQAGEAAPTFRRRDQPGHGRSPADFRGQRLVMYSIAKVHVDVDPEKNSAQALGDLAKLEVAH